MVYWSDHRASCAWISCKWVGDAVKLLKLGVLLIVMACASALAQDFRALISGVVRDSSGAVVPGATVAMRNVETNLTSTVKSANDGAYSIPQLPLGTYELAVEAPGFKKYTRSGITLQL